MNQPIASYKRTNAFPKYENTVERAVSHKNLSAAHVGSIICQGNDILIRTFIMRRRKIKPVFTSLVKEPTSLPIEFKPKEKDDKKFFDFLSFVRNFEKLASQQRDHPSKTVRIKTSNEKVKFNLW
jgi:hypothetical protein